MTQTLTRVILLAACLVLGSCRINTAGLLFDKAGHKAVSDVAALGAGDKVYCRNGQYYVNLPRYRAEQKPAILQAPFAQNKTEMKGNNAKNASASQLFTIPADYACYLCGGSGPAAPAYMEPEWDSSALYGSAPLVVRRSAPSVKKSYRNPQNGVESYSDTADILVGGSIFCKDGRYFISLPCYEGVADSSAVPATAMGGQEGTQWFRIPESYAMYLLGGEGVGTPDSMDPLSKAPQFADHEGTPLVRTPGSWTVTYRYKDPSALIYYALGAADAALIDTPASISASVLGAIGFGGLYLLMDQPLYSSEDPAPPALAAPAPGN